MSGVRFVTCVAALTALLATAARASLPPEIEDPQCVGINKEPAHATLMPYATLEQALAGKRRESPYARSLNGNWKFHWVAHPDQRPLDFYKPEFDSSGWKTIPVPSNWQLLGYGTPYYRNLGYTIQKDWPRVMSDPPRDWTAYEERNPVGSYLTEFEVPADWKGRRVYLTFDGVDSAFYLWINGQKVGYSVNSRNAAEFDITPYLKSGKNLLAAEVYRYSVGTYLEDQDMFRLSGIFRNVTLWSAPTLHIRDFFVTNDLDKQYRDATLKATTQIKNLGDKPSQPAELSLSLYDSKGQATVAPVKVVVPALLPGQEVPVAIELAVPNPAKWTAETPNLYTAVLQVAGGQSTELVSSRVGFRKLEIDGRVFKINGVPVKLKGANRHENWPDTGHYVTEERMIRDIEVLKQCNVNHVRTCHYSDDPRWYELCDEYGLYLNAEANIESHGYGFGKESLSNPPEWKAAHVDRVVANIQSFKNHPSVIIWSLGNEAGRGPNHLASLAAGRAIDKTRPYHYEGFGTGPDNPADLDSEMYTHPGRVEQIAKDPNRTKPFYMCEYAHAMFNSMGSIGEYNDLFDKYPAIMGGGIWEWEDQGVYNNRDPKHPILAYGGGFGEVPNDHYFIHKGVVFSDRSPKPHYPEAKHAYQFVDFELVDGPTRKVRIRNRYAFTNLKAFTPSWVLTEDGKVHSQGVLPPIDLAPGGETVISMPPATARGIPGAEYHLRVAFSLPADTSWAKAGHEVASGQLLVGAVKDPFESKDAKPLRLAQNDGVVSIEGEGFAVQFDRSAGGLASLAKGGTNLLVPGGGPTLHLWRAPHRNDDMWAYGDWERLGLTGLKRECVALEAKALDDKAVQVQVVNRYSGKAGWSALHSALYSVYGDGSIAVDNAVMFHGRRIPIARLGVRLQLDPALDQFQYLGRGPMENYSDRKRGSDVILHSTTVKGNMTPYEKPMECGNHEDVRWAALSAAGKPGLIAAADGALLQVSALPYTDEVMTPIEYRIDLPASQASVLTIAGKTLGVGSNGCGPRPLDPYLVWSDPATFSYVLRLITADQQSSLSEFARTRYPAPRSPAVLGSRNESGKVALTTASAAGIEYSVDGKSWQAYSAPFDLDGAVLLQVRATADKAAPYVGMVDIPAVDPRARWKLTQISSFQPDEGQPRNLLDGSLDTFWHSRWSDPKAEPPHSLTLDLGADTKIAAVEYEARRDMDHGRIVGYELSLSSDGKSWSEPVKGKFARGALTQTIKLPAPTSARFLRLVIPGPDVNGEPYATIAELRVFEATP